jgi:hypothetical protein
MRRRQVLTPGVRPGASLQLGLAGAPPYQASKPVPGGPTAAFRQVLQKLGA